MIAVGQGPALLQSRVTERERVNYGAMLVVDGIVFCIKLDCRWKLVLETT